MRRRRDRCCCSNSGEVSLLRSFRLAKGASYFALAALVATKDKRGELRRASRCQVSGVRLSDCRDWLRISRQIKLFIPETRNLNTETFSRSRITRSASSSASASTYPIRFTSNA